VPTILSADASGSASAGTNVPEAARASAARSVFDVWSLKEVAVPSHAPYRLAGAFLWAERRCVSNVISSANCRAFQRIMGSACSVQCRPSWSSDRLPSSALARFPFKRSCAFRVRNSVSRGWRIFRTLACAFLPAAVVNGGRFKHHRTANTLRFCKAAPSYDLGR
jgi:hypothetical protein